VLSNARVIASLQNLQELKPLDQCLIGQAKENRKKNRYKNILPCKS